MLVFRVLLCKHEDSFTLFLALKTNIFLLISSTGDSSMTAISVSRELELCQDVLMVDMFDHGVGFRKIKDPNADSAAPRDIVASASLLNAGQTGDGINRPLFSSPAESSPQVPRRLQNKAHLQNTINGRPTLAASMDSLLPSSSSSSSTAAPTRVPPAISITSAGNSSLASGNRHLSIDSLSRNNKRGRSQSATRQTTQTFPIDELGRVYNASRTAERNALAAAQQSNNNSKKSGIAQHLLAKMGHKSDYGSAEGLETPGTAIAVTGAALDYLIVTMEDDFLNWMVLSTKIFARIKPNQKAWIVERMMKLGKYVGMCGDG
jgi:magnesium-transporting ATPase (P-type)